MRSIENRPIDGLKVRVKDGEYIDKALRRFKKKVQESGLLKELREREFYEKPTTLRKRKKAAAKNRTHKAMLKNALPKKHNR